MIKRAKSIHEIYEEVKDYELVITVDAPLRTALDRMLNKPTLGTWAVTPKELAGKNAISTLGYRVLNKFDAVIEICRKLGMNIKQAHYYTDLIVNLWENDGSSNQIEDMLIGEGRLVFEKLKDLPIVQKAMEQFDFSLIEAENIAVIGLRFFTELDRVVLPGKYTHIEVFAETDYEIPPFYTFSGENELVDRILSMINNENADDIAIALNPESSYLPLIRSRLINKGIPVFVKEYLKDHFQVRYFLALIDVGLNLSNLTVKDIAHFANKVYFKVEPERNNYQLPEYVTISRDDQRLPEFYNQLNDLTGKTYRDLVNWLTEKKVDLPYEFTEVLYQMGIIDMKVDLESYTDLTYYISNFDVEITTNKSGVLLIDCRNSVYIDRPVCFYIGLDSSWDRSRNRELLDRETEDRKELDSFQILLQQGILRYYFVSTMKDNQSVIPCYYFNTLFNRNIGSFDSDELFHAKRVRNKEIVKESDSNKDNIEAEKPDFKHFSQTTLNRFALCPKLYMYNDLTRSAENEHLLKGTLFHEFVSFYLMYPDYVKEKGDDFFVDLMIGEYKKIAEDVNLDYERTKFKIGIMSLLEYIDSLDIDRDINFPTVLDRSRPNRFVEWLLVPPSNGRTGENTNAELDFRDDELHLSGRLDIVVNNVTVVDHKSGDNAETISQIMREADIHSTKGRLDFQAKIYILEMRKNNPDNIEFIYDYFLSNHKKVIDGNADINENLISVKYEHINFNEFIQTQECLDIIADTSKDRAKLMQKIGYDNLVKFFGENPIPIELQFDSKKMLDSDYADIFQNYFLNFNLGKSKDLPEQIGAILKTIVNIRTGNRSKIALFFKDDIDEFETFLNDKYNEILTFIDDKFPFRPLSKDNCDDCDYGDICLKWYKE
jgi:hypothetical protein